MMDRITIALESVDSTRLRESLFFDLGGKHHHKFERLEDWMRLYSPDAKKAGLLVFEIEE